MNKFVILGVIGVIAIVGVAVYALSKSNEETTRTNDAPVEQPEEKLENIADETTPVEDVDEVKEKVFSNMTERHNAAAELIKQTVEEMNSDDVPQSQNDEAFDNMLNDLDMLSDED